MKTIDSFILCLGDAPLAFRDRAFASTTLDSATRFARMGDAMTAATVINNMIGQRMVKVKTLYKRDDYEQTR